MNNSMSEHNQEEMTMSDAKEVVVLSDDEMEALALFFAARALEVDELVIWDEVPLLAEDGCERLQETIAELANMLHKRLRGHEEQTGTNAREIHGRVT